MNHNKPSAHEKAIPFLVMELGIFLLFVFVLGLPQVYVIYSLIAFITRIYLVRIWPKSHRPKGNSNENI